MYVCMYVCMSMNRKHSVNGIVVNTRLIRWATDLAKKGVVQLYLYTCMYVCMCTVCMYFLMNEIMYVCMYVCMYDMLLYDLK